MILDQKVKVKWVPSNKNFYVNKGYNYTRLYEEFAVDVKDLSPGSKVLVKCICDFCGKVFYTRYSSISNDKFHSCGDKPCTKAIRKQTCLDTYGVENVNQIPGIKQKGADTFRERYGNDSPIHDEYMKKIQQTNIKQFGVPYVFNDKEKMHNMSVKKVATKCNNGTMEISKPQKYLADIFNARINYPFDVYALDMVLFKDDMKVDIEYDGWGHFYFYKNENNDVTRDKFLILNGWKILRIKSKKDFLYNEDNMIFLLNKSLNKLKQIDKVTINVDDNLFISDIQEIIDFDKSTNYLKELK